MTESSYCFRGQEDLKEVPCIPILQIGSIGLRALAAESFACLFFVAATAVSVQCGMEVLVGSLLWKRCLLLL